MQYNSLITMDGSNITVEERDFLILHKEIMYYGNAAAANIVEMAKGLKEMRDGKKYVHADFESFGQYVEAAVGIKERQAYNYISILEQLPEEFLQSNAKLGITKLALLAPLSNKEREEIASEVDLNEVSVRELREKLAEREAEIEQLQIEVGETHKDLKFAEDKISALEKEPKPVVEDPETKKKLKEALSAKEEVLKQLAYEKEKAKKELEELKKQKDAINATALQYREELALLKDQKKPVIGDGVSVFKVKYDDFQRIGKELITMIKKFDNEKPGDAASCRKAMIALLSKITEAVQ